MPYKTPNKCKKIYQKYLKENNKDETTMARKNDDGADDDNGC